MGNELFSFPRSGKKTSHGVEFHHSTPNVCKIERRKLNVLTLDYFCLSNCLMPKITLIQKILSEYKRNCHFKEMKSLLWIKISNTKPYLLQFVIQHFSLNAFRRLMTQLTQYCLLLVVGSSFLNVSILILYSSINQFIYWGARFNQKCDSRFPLDILCQINEM